MFSSSGTTSYIKSHAIAYILPQRSGIMMRFKRWKFYFKNAMNQRTRSRESVRGFQILPALSGILGKNAIKLAQLAFSLCFVLGIISANLLGKGDVQGFGIWNAYFIEKFQYAGIRSDALFLYVLERRLPIFLLLLALTLTRLGVAAGVAFIAWQGFAGGFLIASCILSHGLKGILLVVASIFPQYLVYVPLYLACLSFAIFLRGKTGKENYLRFALVCLLFLLLYVIGMFLESYGNPLILKQVSFLF